MQLPDEIIILLCGIGAVQSYFLAVYILSLRGEKQPANLLLGLLFLALAIRVSKSILWAFWPETPLWIINLGFGAHLSAGPLLLLYIYYFLKPTSQFKSYHFFHFLPALIVFGGLFHLTLGGFWHVGGYSLLLYYHLIYMVAALVLMLLLLRKSEVESSDQAWLRNLWIGVTILGLAYFSNYILGLVSYLSGPILYAVIIYLLSFYGFRHQRIFKQKTQDKKYKNLNLSPKEIQRYKRKLLEAMSKEQPFLQADFSIAKLAKQTAIPSYILSHIINDELGQNFASFSNSYRIKMAKKMLQDPKSSHLKISSIAYDCGFNSLSSFNAAFKKVTQMTPSEWRMESGKPQSGKPKN